jgi:hypothetical protein
MNVADQTMNQKTQYQDTVRNKRICSAMRG